MDKTENFEKRVERLEKQLLYVEKSHIQTTKNMLDLIDIIHKEVAILLIAMCGAVILIDVISKMG